MSNHRGKTMNIAVRIGLSAVVGICTAALFGLVAWGFATACIWGARIDTAHSSPSFAALADLATALGFIGAVGAVVGGVAATIAAVLIILDATNR